jgi:Cu(I)/Ag(I) efflux system protein CusF
MKLTSSITLVLAMSASGFALAQSGGMNHASMQHGAMASPAPASSSATKEAAHVAVAVVKAVNPAKGNVTLAHEPVASLKWPAMTMGFTVKDAKLFDKLVVGSKVTVEFTQQGSDYVVNAVK